jgi:hypothetical protein
VKPFASVPLIVLAFVTTTSTVPDACAGVVAVLFIPLTTTTFVAARRRSSRFNAYFPCGGSYEPLNRLL